MNDNAQVQVPEFLALPGLGVVQFRDWRDDLDAYLASIAAEFERVGVDDDDADTADD